MGWVMAILALDVDGVLLDPDRGGAGHWSNELNTQFGIDRNQIRETFFAPKWKQIVTGQASVEDELQASLKLLGTTADVESVLTCWFEADYIPFEATFQLACQAVSAGHQVVLVTNQEHRRAHYLYQRINESIPVGQIFYSADIGFEKSDRQFFEVVTAKLGLSPDQRSSVVFVDDTYENIEVARSFGWRTVHATASESWHPEVKKLLALY